jgi:hypothetical protein
MAENPWDPKYRCGKIVIVDTLVFGFGDSKNLCTIVAPDIDRTTLLSARDFGIDTGTHVASFLSFNDLRIVFVNNTGPVLARVGVSGCSMQLTHANLKMSHMTMSPLAHAKTHWQNSMSR